MNRQGRVYVDNTEAGLLAETEDGYTFTYHPDYLSSSQPRGISLTLPLQSHRYHSKTMFSFFDGIIPEGWLLDIAEKNWKINPRDRMGLLLACCRDCIGNVSILPVSESEGKG